MPKLFSVTSVISHGDTNTSYIVGNTAEEVEKLILEDDECYAFSAYAAEVKEISGYKVVFKKGKKISLERNLV